ncbi:MAG: MFS transporter [Clostridia bacterium]|nr:MFS transporter [Clostridia bacterium]
MVLKRHLPVLRLAPYSCSLGTIAVYLLLIPGCNALFRTWRAAFIVPALLTLLTAVLMLLFVKKDVPGTENSRPEQAEQSESHREPAPGFREIWRLFLSAGIPLVMLSIVLHGFLRDGVNFWMPSMIKDTYNWGNSSSVISTAILPVFSILCVFITGKLLVMLKSEQTTSLLLWGVTLGSALLLLATYRLSPVFAVAFQAVIFGAVHGIAHLLTSRLPRRFNKYHCVSTFSGLLNASTYLGSAVSSKLSDVAGGGGWNSVILIWIAVSVLGVAATLLNLKRFHRFIRQ